MYNVIFVIMGMVLIGVMIITSNMHHVEKRDTIVLLLSLSTCLAIYFGVIYYWFLIPALLVGCLIGHGSNKAMNRRRMKYIKQAMKENKSF